MSRLTLITIVIAAVLLGITDASYLSYEHYNDIIPPCSTNILFADCGKVLQSPYALVFGQPLALFGTIHYALLLFFLVLGIFFKNRYARYFAMFQTFFGILASLYFVYLQLVVIEAICFYCMASALISVILFVVVQILFKHERKILYNSAVHFLNRNILKRV